MQKPKISVAIRAYNQEKEVIRALQSVLEQTVDCDVEIVVGVDKLTDNSLGVVQEFCKQLPERFTYKILAHKQQMGGGRNFIACLEACTGKYVAILDGDDYWIDPDKNKKQMAVMEKDTQIGLVYGHYIIESPMVEGGRLNSERPKPEENIFTQMLYGNILGTNCSMFRRELLQYVDWDYYLKQDWPQDDYYLWLEIANHTKFYQIPEYCAIYTVARNLSDDNNLYASIAYDKKTTEIREYYIRKYPEHTELTVDDVWYNHYKTQFRHAVLKEDYAFARDAVKKMHQLGKHERYYEFIGCPLVWYPYMLYRRIKIGKRTGLKGYFE